LHVVPSAVQNLLSLVQNGWNEAVQTNILMGTPPQIVTVSDASTVTLATTPVSTHYTLSAFVLPLTAAVSARTVNLSGLVAGDRFLIQLTPSLSVPGSPSPATTITLGSGCVWQAASNGGISSLPNITIPIGQLNPIIVAAIFDGTNCTIYEVQ
jgi:hypothetical protein